MKNKVKITLEVIGAIALIGGAAFAAYLLVPEKKNIYHGSRAKERQDMNRVLSSEDEEIVGI